MLVLFLACGHQIVQEYNLEREQWMTPIPPLGDHWKPDVLLRLNYRLLGEMTEQKIQRQLIESSAFTTKILGTTFTANPELTLDKFSLSNAQANDSINFQGGLNGTIQWKFGKLNGSKKCSASFRGRATIELRDGRATLRVVSVDVLNFSIGRLGGQNVQSQLQDWVKQRLTTDAISIAQFDLQQTPLRALRLATTPTSANIEMRSNTPHQERISTPRLPMNSDWELLLHKETLLGWMRSAAFEQGVIQHGLAVDPRDISFSDQQFSVDLRVWKLVGRGKWWREYTATGVVQKEEQHLNFIGQDVSTGEKSRGANLVDPLALLAEGMILRGVSDNVLHALPLQYDKSLNWALHIKEFGGQGNQFSLSGDLSEKE